jgi:hypothetical protein
MEKDRTNKKKLTKKKQSLGAGLSSSSFNSSMGEIEAVSDSNRSSIIPLKDLQVKSIK